MKKLLLLSLVGVLSSYASNYTQIGSDQVLISSTSDPKEKLQMLEIKKIAACQTKLDYNDCAKTTAAIAAITTLWTQQYTLAIQNAEQALTYFSQYQVANSLGVDVCFPTWNEAYFSYTDRKNKNLPSTFPMIYYLALKGANDKRAEENLDKAYLCELIKAPDSVKTEQILVDYLKNSMQIHDPVNQTYVKRFITEIYRPLKQAESQIYRNNSKNQPLGGKIFVLYQNALAQSNKIGLPLAYKNYIKYYIHLYDGNK